MAYVKALNNSCVVVAPVEIDSAPGEPAPRKEDHVGDYVEENATLIHCVVEELFEKYGDTGFLGSLRVEKVLEAISKHISLKTVDDELDDEHDNMDEDFLDPDFSK